MNESKNRVNDSNLNRPQEKINIEPDYKDDLGQIQSDRPIYKIPAENIFNTNPPNSKK